MIMIRPIRPDEISAAKRVIFSVAYGIYGWQGSLEENIRRFDSSDEFQDMDDVEAHYFQQDGLFLAVLDDNTLIGSGAIRKIDTVTAELKRMWLLEAYHGKGIGLQVIMRLFEFARSKHYQRIRLQTSPEQTRALASMKSPATTIRLKRYPWKSLWQKRPGSRNPKLSHLSPYDLAGHASRHRQWLPLYRSVQVSRGCG